MTTPWNQVLAEVPTLRDEQAPYTFSVEEDAIVGYWDIAKIEMLGLTGVSSFSKDYRITVRPAGDDKFEYSELHTESQGAAGAEGDGFGARGSKEWQFGKSTEKSFGIEIGLAGRSHDESTNVASWNFDDKEIKDPLFAFLESHGWEQKGFFGRLFS